MKRFLSGVFATMRTAFSLATVDVDAASSAELEALPGIGPAKTRAVMECRQKNGAFKSVEELRNVKGIGNTVLNRLKTETTVSSVASKTAQLAVKR